MTTHQKITDMEKPKRKPASPTFITFTLAMSLFAFMAAICAFNPHIGNYLRTPHWEANHLTLFMGTFALASGIAAVAIRPLGRGRGALAWPMACAIWLLVAGGTLLFVLRYPAEFSVQYNKNIVEDQVPDALEEQALVFNHPLGPGPWGAARPTA